MKMGCMKSHARHDAILLYTFYVSETLISHV